MDGLGSLLGSFITSAATPAIGGLAGEAVSTGLDLTQNELLKDITQTTVGALAGAGVGAGLGALTGGKAGALGGALTGGVGGGLGGYNAQEIAKIFGGQQSVGPSQGSQVEPQASPMGPVSNADIAGRSDLDALLMGKQSPAQMSAVRSPISANAPVAPNLPPVQQPAPATPQPSALKGYTDFLKQNFEPLALGSFGGTALTTTNQYNQSAEKYKRQQQLEKLMEQQNALNFARSVYGYADGGAVNLGISNPNVHIHLPAWAQEDFQREGGLAALQPGIDNGFANGGYVNTAPFDPNEFYPQSRIPSAKPYPGAASTSVVNTLAHGASFARGGLIEGDGDGMSDSIPARVSGQEEVRVADGEYHIPKEIVAKFGKDKLHKMMTNVRKSAHAKKGAQIQQDAGKRAFIKTLTGVKA